MESHDFYIGQKVVCIDDAIKPEFIIDSVNLFQQWITKGKTYTVRQVLDNDGIATALLLEGVTNKPVYIALLGRDQEPAFADWRFRPLEETTEEIETEIENEILC